MEQKRFLFIIHFLYSLQDTHRVFILSSRINQGFHILWKTRTAISDTCIQETVTDTTIRSDPLAHHIHISTNNLTQIRDIIHKADAGSQHGIRSILGHLRRRHIHKNNTEIVQKERTVQTSHQLFCTLRLNTYDYTVRTHKITDRSSFFQEFRIGSNIKFNLYPTLIQLFLDSLAYFFSSTDRHCTFRYNQNVLFDIAADSTCHFKHILQVCTAIFVGRCTYGTEQDFYLIQALCQISCKM